MPLEIRQVVIRAEIDTEAGKSSAGAQPRGDVRGAQREDFVQEIVDQVMQVLEDRKAR